MAAQETLKAISSLITNDQDTSAVHDILLAYILSCTTSPVAAATDLFTVSCAQGDAAEDTASNIAALLTTIVTDVPVLRNRIGTLVAEINNCSYATYGVQTEATERQQKKARENKDAASRGFWKGFHEFASEYFQVKANENRDRSARDVRNEAEWHALNGFLACYVARNCLLEGEKDEYYNSGDAFTTLSRLEEEFEDKENNEYNADADVPAAALWFIEAGDAIWRLCRGGRCQSGQDVRGPMWKGERDFNEKRWAFWKVRFELASGLDFVQTSTRASARSAVMEMDRLDGCTKAVGTYS
ncbi:hypothetical protein LTR50_007541 [Elasticomyces elasticus]|nr:hypothetical protein LTR50_007541 [Elasticomyces elasticus]